VRLVDELPLGLRTHLLTAPSGLRMRRQGELLVLRTADFDTFYFGNVLCLPAPPRADDLPGLLEQWQMAFADAPGVAKVVLQWETRPEQSEDPELELAASEYGLTPARDIVLRLGTFSPSQPRVPMQARIVETDADWQAAVEVATDPNDSPGRKAFTAWRRAEHRTLADAGRGLWWLGEADGQPVSSAGIYWDKDGTLARFQSVDTRANARGQGFASALLSTMTEDIVGRLPRLETCVIVAEIDTQAERIYRRLGYEPASKQVALWGDRANAIR
jgi:ribosomal protein S18 acetylase RimI-like enzyme